MRKERNAATNRLIYVVTGVASVVVLFLVTISALVGGDNQKTAAPSSVASSLTANLSSDASFVSATAEPPADGRIIEGKVVAISDGDTITVLNGNNREHKIRFAGIDAPEAKQDFGSRAKENLSKLVFGKTVRVVAGKTDKYGRTVGVVLLDGKDINLEQINAGFAWHYKEYESEQSEAERTSYAEAETAAREAKIGLWSAENPTAPWAWRRGANVKPEDSGKIFGNSASMIYHWAGCPGFTKIGEKNRVVFATASEAEAAGYRAAKNCTAPVPTDSPAPDTGSGTLEATVETENRDAEILTPVIVPVPVDAPAPTTIVRQATPEPEVYRPRLPESTASSTDRDHSADAPAATSAAPTARCNDGTVSYSTHRQGTCSHHGGVSEWLDDSTTRSKSPASAPRYPTSDAEYRPKTVHVDGYYRKDGTYVRPHTRSAPRRRN